MVAHGVVADIQGHVLKLAWKARLDEHRLSLVSYAETTQLVSVSPSISGSCDPARMETGGKWGRSDIETEASEGRGLSHMGDPLLFQPVFLERRLERPQPQVRYDQLRLASHLIPNT